MMTGNKGPFVNENIKMKKALKILSEKKLGVLIIRNKNKNLWYNHRRSNKKIIKKF